MATLVLVSVGLIVLLFVCYMVRGLSSAVQGGGRFAAVDVHVEAKDGTKARKLSAGTVSATAAPISLGGV